MTTNLTSLGGLSEAGLDSQIERKFASALTLLSLAMSLPHDSKITP